MIAALLSLLLLLAALPAQALLLGTGIDDPSLQPPTCPLPIMVRMAGQIVYAEDYGAKGDGVTDDLIPLQRAADSAANITVVLQPGKRYLKSDTLYLRKTNVQLWGYKAWLFTHSFRPPAPRTTIVLSSPGTAVYGVTIVSDLKERGTSDLNSACITLAADNTKAIDNSCQYTQIGIMVRNATNFDVTRNVIYRTYADGIHITSGSSKGRVTCNTVRENGDDGVAVVGYGVGKPLIGEFVISYNDIGKSYKGRGISVIGAFNTTLSNNTIADVHMGAGIYIASEWQYKTGNTTGVTVESNSISNIRLSAADPAKGEWNPLGVKAWVDNGQPAIFVYGTAGFLVSDVKLTKNIITRPRKNAIEVSATSCGVVLNGNVFNQVTSKQLQDSSSAGCVVQQ